MSRSLDQALARMQTGDSPAASIVAPMADQARQLAGLRRKQQADLTNIISSGPAVLLPAGVTSLSLGTFSGDGITGVRCSVHGVLASVTVAGGGSHWWWRINGAVQPNLGYVETIAYLPVGGAYTVAGDAHALASLDGLPMGVAGFTNVGQTNHISSTSTLFTSRLNGQVRHSISQFSSSDGSGDFMTGTAYGQWFDTTTVISSLSLLFDGTFTGRVEVETLP